MLVVSVAADEGVVTTAAAAVATGIVMMLSAGECFKIRPVDVVGVTAAVAAAAGVGGRFGRLF